MLYLPALIQRFASTTSYDKPDARSELNLDVGSGNSSVPEGVIIADGRQKF